MGADVWYSLLVNYSDRVEIQLFFLPVERSFRGDGTNWCDERRSGATVIAPKYHTCIELNPSGARYCGYA